MRPSVVHPSFPLVRRSCWSAALLGGLLAVVLLGLALPAHAEDVVTTFRSAPTLVRGPVAMAVNPVDHSVWTADLTSGHLIHLRQDGHELWRGSGYPNVVSLAVSPGDGSVWVAVYGANQVRHVSATTYSAVSIASTGPRCVSVGQYGDCWVAEETGNTVARIRQSNTVAWRRTGYMSPWGIAAHSSDGTCWVANTGANSVCRLDANGNVLKQVGGLNSPRSVAIRESTGQVYVADSNNNRVVRVNADGSGVITYTAFNLPQYLAFNSTDQTVWVTDSTKTTRLNENLGLLVSVSGFSAPRQVSVDTSNGECWVADCWNNQVVRLDRTGAELFRSWVGYMGPVSVSADAAGDCWVAEQNAGRVARVTADGTLTWRTVQGLLSGPHGVSVDPSSGACWVSDGTNRVMRLSPTGAGTSLAYLAAGAAPQGITTYRADGSCWVTENAASAVTRVSSTGTVGTRLTGIGAPFDVDVSQSGGWIVVAGYGVGRIFSFNSDGTARWSSAAVAPRGVAIDQQDGSVWVAEQGANRVSHLDSTGALLGATNVGSPCDVAVAGDRTVWVACGPAGRVVHLAADGTVLSDTAVSGYPVTVAAGRAATDRWCWVGDTANDVILRLEVLPPNVPPVASFTYTPAAPVTAEAVQFTDTSTDPDGGAITAWSWDFGDRLTSTLQSPGHKFAARGAYTVSLTVTDNRGGANTASQQVTIGNAPPVALNATLTILADTIGTGQLQATDADHDSLTYSLVDPAGVGTAVVQADGSYTYTPPLGFVGDDSFTFKANDGFVDSSPATGTIHVIVYQDTMRVSVASDGTQGNQTSFDAAVSGDGRYVAFASYANNLVPGHLNTRPEIFVHDRLTKTTELATSDGAVLANDACTAPCISADGRYVAYQSTATNLFSPDYNGTCDVFLYDRLAGDLRLVSMSTSGASANGGSQYPDISGDGGVVVFQSGASDLVAGDTPGLLDIYAYFTATRQIVRLTPEVGQNTGAKISADGRYVAFTSTGALLPADGDTAMDVYVCEMATGALELIDVPAGGTGCYVSSISADGRYLTLETTASLTPDDTNTGTDAYRVDRLTGDIVRASVPAHGLEQTFTVSMGSDISADGRFVTFYAPAANTFVAEDLNGRADIYLRDLLLGTTNLVSLAVGGEQGTGDVVQRHAISADGTCIAFSSYAPNLVPLDTNNTGDVFARKCVLQAPNTWPTAAADAYSVNQDTLLEVAAPGVLGNDTDTEGDPLTATVVTEPSHDQAFALASDGTLSYLPEPGFVGTDTFTYRVEDGSGGDSVATVTITVNQTNWPPVAVDDTFTATEGQQLVVDPPGILANDTDPDAGDVFAQVEVVDFPMGVDFAIHNDGSFAINSTRAGTVTFTYRARDLGGLWSNVATVTVDIQNVNDNPLACNDSAVAGRGLATPVAVLDNDTDEDGDTLTVTAVTQPANGAVTFTATGVTYTSAGAFTGNDSFTYTVSDGNGGTATATVSVRVVEPVVVDAGDASARPGQVGTVTVSLSTPVPDQAAVQTCYSNLRTLGMADMMYAVDYQVLPSATTGLALVEALLPYVGDVNTFMCPYTGQWYQPNPDLAGADPGRVDPGTWLIRDAVPHPDGSRCTAFVDGHIEVGSAYAVGSVEFDLGYNGGQPGLLSVSAVRAAAGLPADWTVESAPVSADVVHLRASGPTAIPLGGAVAVVEIDLQAPAGHPGGVVSTMTPSAIDVRSTAGEPIVPTAADAGAFTVLPANHPPVLDPIGDMVVEEGTLLTFTVTASDPDSDPLTFWASGLPTGATFDPDTQTFSWQVPDYPTVPDKFLPTTFTVSDGDLTDSETIVIIVTERNEPPVLDPIGDQTGAEGQLLTFDVSATDPNFGQPTAATVTGLPTGATWNWTPAPKGSGGWGTFAWTPSYDQAGAYPVTIEVSDGTLTDSETFTINIANTNRPPELTNPGDQTVAENDALTFTISATDADGDTLTYGATGLPAGASLDPATGTFTWTPGYDQAGSYNVTFTVSDGTATDSESITITIENYDRDPDLANPGTVTGAEGSPLTFTLSATDPDGDSITYGYTGDLPARASLTGAVFIWTPGYDQAGSYNVTFTASDGELTDTEVFTINIADTNRPPVFGLFPKNQYATEGMLYERTVPASDPDGDTVTFSVSGPAGLEIDQAGLLTWTPGYDQAGDHDVTVTISDGSLSTPTALIFHVANANRPPVIANPGDQTVAEGSLLTFTVTATDPDGDPVSIEATALPAGALFNAKAATFSWTPGYDQAGAPTATFVASDGTMTDSATITITVTNTNQPPVLAEIGPQSLAEGQQLTLVLSATDPDNDPITYSATGLPDGATFNGGVFLWQTDYDDAGSYPVTFTAGDGTDSDSETVIITVTNINRPPAIDQLPMQTVAEMETLTLTFTGSDPDGDPLTWSVVRLPAGASFDPATQVFTWTPDYDQQGLHHREIVVEVTDGTQAVQGEVDVMVTNVNRPPVLDPVDNQTVTEGQTLTFNVTGSDPDSMDWLTLTTTALPTGASLDYLGGPVINGTFAWTPSTGQAGSYPITFTLTDAGGLTSTQSMTITVRPPNHAPVLEPIGDQTVVEGDTITIVLAATDPDGDALTYAADNLPPGGAFDPATRTFTWTAPPYGTIPKVWPVTFTVSDGSLTDSETVNLMDVHRNQPPVLDPIGNQAGSEGQLLTFEAGASDPEWDHLTMTATGLPAGATFTCTDPLQGRYYTLEWTPGFDQAGTYTVTVEVSDGKATDSETFTITIANANRPPVLTDPGPQTGAEGQVLTFTLSATDPDGDSVTYSATGLPTGAGLSAAGVFTWPPAYDQAGDHTVTFTASDGTLTDSKTVTITVTNTNRPPDFISVGLQTVNEGETLTLTVQATDPDGDSLTYSQVSLPTGASFDPASQTLTWTPGFEQGGGKPVSVVLAVSDGSLSTTMSFEIQVVDINRPPALDAIDNQSGLEGQSLTFQVSASDPDNDALSITFSGLPAGATFTNNDFKFGRYGTVEWTPGYDQAGTYTVTAQVSDGALTDSQTFTITIANVNRPPVLPAVPDQSVAEGSELAFTVQAEDADGDTITYGSGPLPAGAALNAQSGVFTWTPTYQQAGTYPITVTAGDGSVTVERALTITVTNVNLPPVLTNPGDQTVVEVQTLTFTLSATDPDGDALTFSADVLPTGASLTGDVFTWTPAAGQAAAYPVTFTVSDGTATHSQAITIIVLSAGNTPPGTPVTANLPGGISVTFSEVTTGGETTLTTSTTPPHGPPTGFHILGGMYFDISTTAGYVPPITVTFPYDPADVHGPEENLRLFHERLGGGWEDCTVSVDTVNNTITGQVNSLSWFCIGEPEVTTYTWLGFQEPLTIADKLFKKGSTIPVKFRLSTADGQPVTDAHATLAVFYLVAGAPEGEAEVVSTAAGDVGNVFRYDPAGDLYIFNLSTKPNSFKAPYTYRAIVTLDDGTTHSIDFSLKK